jgi:hypothetical protein
VGLRSGELHKHGIRFNLQDQPFQVLALQCLPNAVIMWSGSKNTEGRTQLRRMLVVQCELFEGPTLFRGFFIESLKEVGHEQVHC